MIDDIDLDLDLDEILNKKDVQKQYEPIVLKRKSKNILRRCFGEEKLLNMFKEENIDYDCSYHFLIGGKIDFLSFLSLILRQQSIRYCLLSTWCMKLDDVLQIEEWLSDEKIGQIDVYVGEIFPASYKQEWLRLKQVVGAVNGRVCVFRNHSKVFAGTGEKFSFGVASSANIDTNPRTENTVMSFGDDIFSFYKDYFDGIISFNREFDDWKKWDGEQ